MPTSIVVNSPRGAPHSIFARMAAAEDARRGKTSASDKDTARWYQDFVDYYLKRRSEYAAYWKQVESQYNRGRDMARRRAAAAVAVVPGRVYDMVHSTEAQVLGTPPKFHFEGWTPTVERDQVPAFERAINNEWGEDRSIMQTIALGVRDCVKTGWGICLTSYSGPASDGATTESARLRRQQEADDPMLAAAIDEVATKASLEASLADSPEQLEDFELDTRVRTGTISSRRISPWHFVCDPDATCLDDASIVGRIIVRRLDAVLADPNFKGKTEGLQASLTQSFDFYGSDSAREKWRTSEGGSNPYDLVELYELFERRLDGRWDMVVIARDHPTILRKEEAFYWVGCPYSLLRWNDDGEEIFAQPDVAIVQDQLDAEVLLYTKSMDGYARDQEDTIFVDARAGITEKEWHAVNAPGVSKKIEVTVQQGSTLRDLIMKLPRDSKSAEPMNFLAMIQRAVEMGTGRGPNQAQQTLKSGASATEAQIIAQNALVSSSHKSRAGEAFVLDVALKRLGLMVQFYDKERMTRLAGPEAAASWRGGPSGTMTENDITLGLRVTVERGSMRPRDDAQLFQDMVTIATISANNPILFGNTDWATWQIEAYKALLGVAGENLLISADTEEINNATKNLFALQNSPLQQGGGSKPAQPGVASPRGAGNGS